MPAINSSRSLGEHFVQAARENWRRRCISDSMGKDLSYGQTLARTVALRAEIDKLTEGEENVGILLPASVAGALTNLAITMSGKVTVNLNYVAGARSIQSAVEQCGIKTIITSRSFMEKTGNPANLSGLIYLEDITAGIGFGAKVKAYLRAMFASPEILANTQSRCGDDLATIIFSSGTSGEPKGVMLSHHNILSNVESVRAVFQLRPDDNVCGVLPFFHSFGFTCSFWLALVSGVSASYITNPLDGRAVGQSVRRNRSTMLFAAPTFLLNYARRTEREDFANLRMVMVGAEKLKKSVADTFEAKFGIRPLEGYGCTELSPVVSLSLTQEQATGLHKVGNKEGAVGLAIPGVELKIVSLETGEPVGIGRRGLLTVKGPNVMLGYLNKPKETAEVLKDGWYNTGDIGSIDEDGFLTITDRLSRFSKIAGEMVSHIGVERIYMDGLNTDERVVAVTGIPEAKKGEELVVLYVEQAGGADKLHEIVAGSELPNTWKPRRDNYIKIESMPALGSGKLDVVRLRKIALEAKNSVG